MVTMIMLLLLVSYYFIAIKYSQEALLEFASVRAITTTESTNVTGGVGTTHQKIPKFDTPQQLIAYLSERNISSSHIVFKGSEVLAHNLPSQASGIQLKKNNQDIELSLNVHDSIYTLALTEQEGILQSHQGWQLVTLPNKLFDSSVLLDDTGLTIEHKFYFALLLMAMIAIGITWVVTKTYLKPIEFLIQGFEQLALGDSKTRIEGFRDDELGHLASQFNATLVELEKLEQERKDMITDVAHELRTPLNNLQVKVEAVIDGVVEVDVGTFPALLAHVNGLSHLVNDLQDLSLAEAGRLSFENKCIQTMEVIQTNYELFRAVMTTKDIDFQVAHAEPAFIEADPNRLNQILFNIIENARKYTPNEGTINLYGYRDQGFYHFGVIDSGPGLPKELQQKVFARSYRANNKDTSVISGHGLGLSIAQKLVQLMGGGIYVDSSEYGGLKVAIKFPLLESCHRNS
jgi:signal transduction histidine kinase